MLFGLAASPRGALAEAPRRTVPPVLLLRRPIAGLPYYDYARLAGMLAGGAPLALRREPENPYDRRAIAVLTQGGAKLGYVPRVDNAVLASLMDAGAELLGRSQRVWMAVSLAGPTMTCV
jgi:hypothetical protein